MRIKSLLGNLTPNFNCLYMCVNDSMHFPPVCCCEIRIKAVSYSLSVRSKQEYVCFFVLSKFVNLQLCYNFSELRVRYARNHYNYVIFSKKEKNEMRFTDRNMNKVRQRCRKFEEKKMPIPKFKKNFDCSTALPDIFSLELPFFFFSLKIHVYLNSIFKKQWK